MKRFLVAVVAVLFLALPASSQSSKLYAVGGFGDVVQTDNFRNPSRADASIAGGLSLPVYKGASVGAELGYGGRADSLKSGLAQASINAYYHFRHKKAFQPFVSSGYAVSFSDIHRLQEDRVFASGGFDYFPSKKSSLGLRVEGRNDLRLKGGFSSFSGQQSVSVRAGVVYRF